MCPIRARVYRSSGPRAVVATSSFTAKRFRAERQAGGVACACFGVNGERRSDGKSGYIVKARWKMSF